jgi:F0F1-type ATP synthase assembly protein I
MVDEKKLTQESSNSGKSRGSSNGDVKTLALVSFQSGCLTMILAGLALVIGLFLDFRFGTPPKFTLIFVLGSAPLVLGLIFFLARRTMTKRSPEKPPSDSKDETLEDV